MFESLAIQLNGAIEVPVLLEDKVIRPTINIDNPQLHGVTRLLVASLDGHTIDAAIIKYYPTEKFVGNIEEINRDNFREKKFDGMIKLENFDFTDQKVVLIENGKLTHFMGQNLKYDPNREDYTVCFPAQVCQSVSVPSAGYYGPTTCSFDGSYYCVTVPTDYNNNSNTNTAGISSSATGINSSSVGILGAGTITPVQKLCAESVLPLKEFQYLTLQERFDSQQTGLINVNIKFLQLDGSSSYDVNFDYLKFVVKVFDRYIDNAPEKITTAFNQAVTNTQSNISLNHSDIPNGLFPIVDNNSTKQRFLQNLENTLTANLGYPSFGVALSSNPNSGISPSRDRYLPMSAATSKNVNDSNAKCE